MDDSLYRGEYLRAVYGAMIDGRREEFTFASHRFARGVEVLLGVSRPWAIVSAWNPMSRRLEDSENRRRNGELLAAIERAGCGSIPAWGRNIVGDWLEESRLIWGCSREGAVDLARAFKQRAIVWCEGERVGLLDGRNGVWTVRPVVKIGG